MKMIIAPSVSYLYIFYRLRKERQQHAKTRKRSRKDREILSYKIQTTEQKLDELEDRVFEHVSTLEEQEMAGSLFDSTQPLIRGVIRRIQDYARRAIEISDARYKGIIEGIMLRDLIWDRCIKSGAVGELNPETRKRILSATLKQLTESQAPQEWL